MKRSERIPYFCKRNKLERQPNIMSKFRTIILGGIFASTLLLTSCSTLLSLSDSYTFTKVKLGMTREEVYKQTRLRPIKVAKHLDKDGSEIEIFYFKTLMNEWDKTAAHIYANQRLVFRNGRLIAVEQGDEQIVYKQIPNNGIGISVGIE